MSNLWAGKLERGAKPVVLRLCGFGLGDEYKQSTMCVLLCTFRSQKTASLTVCKRNGVRRWTKKSPMSTKKKNKISKHAFDPTL